MSITVYDYFTRELGVAPNDDTLKELFIDDNCGHACVIVIDYAKAYLDVADPSPLVKRPLLQSVNVAVEVLWRG